MPRLKIIIATLTLLALTLACRAATDIFSPEEESSPAPLPTKFVPTQIQPTDEVTETLSCPVLLTDIMSAALEVGSDIEAQEIQYIVTYTVNGDQLSDPYYEDVTNDLQDEQDDSSTHEFVWEYFTALIPADKRTFIAEYSITTDGVDNTLAAVTQTYNDPKEWVLEVDILDINDTYTLTFTLVHEFGHLLTLNAEQVPPSERVFNNPDNSDIYESERADCLEYFPGEGCSIASSYINVWHDQFWVDIYDEWDEINYAEDDDTYYEMLDDFYYKYEDQFVTDYAATTPEEDIAESWSFFVLAPKPTGNSIADQKVLFFYDYPEFVQLREEILNNLCEAFPQ
ncbi:MAG TPA: hypothetical protein VLA72_21730 [Anaerolineales bacterium]|nr:hypothetical protein [Anaerolineales bacterium]